MREPEDLDVAGAIARFLADLAIGKSPATVTTYRTALRHFQAGLAASQPHSQTPANGQEPATRPRPDP
jgi:hypothetical protein